MSGRVFVVLSVVLLAVSGLVRLPRLAERSLWLDEAKTANHARQSFADTVVKTRLGSSAPVVYPLLLNLVQRVADSAVAVRLPSLVASVAAVAVLLALPLAGVGREAALIAAAILAVSPAQVRYAQEVREYALAVLVAAVLVVAVAGCAAGARHARFVLVAGLFVAPLVQYGLVLLAAVSLAVAVAAVWVRRGASGAVRLAAAGSCGLVAASLLSIALTLRGQWRHTGVWYLEDSFLSGSVSDLTGVLEFLVDRLPALLAYLTLADGAVVLVVPAAGLLLLAGGSASAAGRSVAAVALLATVAVAGGALVGLYPLGPIRQDLFVAPAVAAAVGVGWAGLAALMPERSRPISTVLLAACVVAGGAFGIVHARPYREVEDIRSVIAALEARRGSEPVYVYYGAWPALRFYRVGGPGFVYGGSHRGEPGGYAREFRALVGDEEDRVWLVFSHVFSGEDRRLLADLGSEWCFEIVVESTGAWLVHGRRRGDGHGVESVRDRPVEGRSGVP